MPRRPVSRRATALLAACLRATATFAQQAAQRLDGAGSPDPAELQPAEVGGPVAVGGPPEHWRALVAQRAPGLLRGAGLGTARVPAAQPRPAASVPAPGSDDARRQPTAPRPARDGRSRRSVPALRLETGADDRSGTDPAAGEPRRVSGVRVVPADVAEPVARRSLPGTRGPGVDATGRGTMTPGRGAANLLSRVRVEPGEPATPGRPAVVVHSGQVGADPLAGPAGWAGRLTSDDPLASDDPAAAADPLVRAGVPGRTTGPRSGVARYGDPAAGAGRERGGYPGGTLPSRRAGRSADTGPLPGYRPAVGPAPDGTDDPRYEPAGVADRFSHDGHSDGPVGDSWAGPLAADPLLVRHRGTRSAGLTGLLGSAVPAGIGGPPPMVRQVAVAVAAPWPDLPDDAALWTASVGAAYPAELLHRLDAEQVGE